MMVSQKEIIEALRKGYSSLRYKETGYMIYAPEMADRIEAEGIAPPDGYELVPINDEAAAPKGVVNEQE